MMNLLKSTIRHLFSHFEVEGLQRLGALAKKQWHWSGKQCNLFKVFIS